MKNRILALFLVLCMAFSMLPVSAMAEDQIIEEELENDNANLTQVTFVCTPLEAKVSVKSDTLDILPQEDGSFLLPIGEYTYTVTAEGYHPLADQALSISADTEAELELKPVLVQIQEGKNGDNLDNDILDDNVNDNPATDDNAVVGTDNDGDDNGDGGENIEQNNSIELQTITVSVPSSTVDIPVVVSQNQANNESFVADNNSNLNSQSKSDSSSDQIVIPDVSEEFIVANKSLSALNTDTDSIKVTSSEMQEVYAVRSGANPYGYDQTFTWNGTKVTTVRCTWYAWQQAYDNLGVSMPGWSGHAKTWLDSAASAGYDTGSTPMPGSIAVWTSSDWGHVAYVVSVQDGSMTVNEGGMPQKPWGYDNRSGVPSAVGTTRNGVGTLIGYIYLTPQNKRPDGYVDSCVGGKGTISIRGWAKDSDTPDLPLTIHVYVGGNAGEGGRCYTRASDETLLIANQYRSDGGIGNHGFDFTIKVEEQGENIPVYVWALDGQGENNNKCINGRGDDEGRVLTVNVQGSSLLHEHSIGFRETTGGSFYCEVNGVQTNEVNAGDKVKIIATPDTGKEIEFVTIRRTSDLAELSYSTDLQFDMPSSDVDILVTFCDIGIPIDEEHFPDPVFRQYVLDNIDTFNGGNGYLNNAEIQAVTTIGGDLYGLKSLDGMHLFPNLTRLSVHQTDLEALDLSKYPGLIEVHGSHNPKLTTVTLGSSTVLALLHFPQSPIISLDLRNCPNLLDAYQNGEKQDGSFDSLEFVAYKTSDSSLMVMSSTEIITDSNPEPSSPANLPLAKYVNENEIEIAASQTLQLNDRGCIDISEPDDSGWYNKLIAPTISGYKVYMIVLRSEEETETTVSPDGQTTIVIMPTFITSEETQSKVMFLHWDASSSSWDVRAQSYDYIHHTDDIIDSTFPFCKSRPILTYYYKKINEESSSGIAIDETNFPDPIFRQYVADNFDTDETKGYLSVEEIAAIGTINCSNLGIASLKGIEHFTSLAHLFCLDNNLTTIDVSKNTNLIALTCDGNMLTALDVSANTNLLYLRCSRNQLTEIDVSNNSRLAILNIDANQLTVLDISKNPDLIKIINGTQGLERSEDENSYYYGALFSYDKNVTLITGETTDEAPMFPDYTLVADPASLICPVGEPITMTVQTKGTGLTYRWQCQVSQTTQILDFTTNILTLTAETSMDGYRYYCIIKDPYGVQIDTRPLEITVVYKHIVQSGETLSGICTSYGLDYDACKEAIDTLNGEGFDANNLSIGQEILLPISNASAARIAEPSAADGIAINETNFPDPVFRQYVADRFDIDSVKGYLSKAEIAAITYIETYGSDDKKIVSVKGIELFPELRTLRLDENAITSIDLTHNLKLEHLDIGRNQLTSIDLSCNSELVWLSCNNNFLTTLDLSYTPGLAHLFAYYNNIPEIDITNNPTMIKIVTAEEPTVWGNNGDILQYDPYKGEQSRIRIDKGTKFVYGAENPNGIAINETNFPDPIFRQYVSDNFDIDETKGYLSAAEIKAVTDIACMNMGISSLKGIEFFTELSSLSCAANPLGSIDVSKNTKLFVFICRACQLTELDVSQNTALTALSCQENSLTSLDVSKLTGLHHLDCSFNNLTSLDISKIPVLLNSYTNGTQYDKGSYAIYSETDDGLIVNNLTVDKNVKIITASLVNITISTPAGINVEIIPKSFLNGKELSEDDATHTTWPKIGFITLDGIITRTCPPGMLDGKLQALETYSYASGTGGDYPTGMDVWLLEKDEDTGNYNAVRADFLDNLLVYSGTSIRIKGNQGIAVHTTLNTAVWNQLVNGGYHGYQVEEAGLLVSVLTNGGVSDPVLGDPGVIKGVSYERTGSMKSINPNGDTSYYMNTIVFGTDLSKTKWDLACRPYIRLTNADGEEVILYGGTLVRSVRSVAKQIESIYKNDATISKFIQTILDY